MIWNIISIFLSVLSIGVSILCWRFAYSNVKKYNKYVSQLYNIDLFKENSYREIGDIAEKIYKLEKSEQKSKIEFSHQKCPDEKIPKEDLITCLFNAYINILKECDRQKNDKKSGN